MRKSKELTIGCLIIVRGLIGVYIGSQKFKSHLGTEETITCMDNVHILYTVEETIEQFERSVMRGGKNT